MEDQLTVTIKNWHKFQSEHGRNTYLWFRFYLNFFRDGHHLQLGDSGTTLFTFLLCECGARRSETVTINRKIACAQLGWTGPKLDQNFSLLISKGSVVDEKNWTAKSNMKLPTICVGASPDRIEENRIENTIVQSAKADMDELDFESLYQKYPRKEGKTPGMQICKRTIKTKADFDALSLAIAKYAARCATEQRDKKYIMLFKTFMGQWRDVLEPGWGGGLQPQYLKLGGVRND